MDSINGYSFDVSKIVDYLRPFKDNLAPSYKWGSPTNRDLDKAYREDLFDDIEMNNLLNMDSSYERNVYLKHIISRKLIDPKKGKDTEYYNWIVKVWGGINAFGKDADNVHDSIRILLNEDYLKFDGIASMSKIASFMFPEKYVIYDARVSYSLNWILLKNEASSKFFPVPESRNTKLNAFNIDVIIRLANVENYRYAQMGNSNGRGFIRGKDKNHYIAQSEAYTTLCKLVGKVNDLLWEISDEKRKFPFYTEMILFALADQEVLIDIINSCNLVIE